jgi:hypothetical protein
VSRASAAEHVQRLNMAVDLLKKNASPQEVVSSLVHRAHVSVRQAYRYLQKAQQGPRRLPLPEAKAVFTVKLPESLIVRVRRQARHRGQPISDWVGQALQAFLERSQRHG